mmetsp:Transcript_10367/g.42889  ORF Transcript_10367/g.42889 Transcript_10367/m.42889 type:complete len:211 (+) Transcript_10367:146-778(+)
MRLSSASQRGGRSRPSSGLSARRAAGGSGEGGGGGWRCRRRPLNFEFESRLLSSTWSSRSLLGRMSSFAFLLLPFWSGRKSAFSALSSSSSLESSDLPSMTYCLRRKESGMSTRPMCHASPPPTNTMGPSRPTGTPAAMTRQMPSTLTTSVRKWSAPSTVAPLRKTAISGRPEPPASGASATTPAAAGRTSAAAMPAAAKAPPATLPPSK